MLYCKGVPENALLAVSGGGDSMALLYMMTEQKIPFAVGHIQHGETIPQIAAAELVELTARKLQLPYHVKAVSAPSRGGSGYEAKARKLRYQAFSEWIIQFGYTAVATAHTLDDVAETVAIATYRKQGIVALAGIPENRTIQISPGTTTQVVRPLINYLRQELRDWLESRNLEWFEDPTNLDPTYGLRNRIRYEWSKLSPLEYAAKISQQLQIANSAHRRIVIAEEIVNESWKHVAELHRNEVRLPTPWLRSLDSDALQMALVRIVRHLGQEAGGLPGGHRRQWEHLLNVGGWGTVGSLGKTLAYRITKRQCWIYKVSG
ncbi:MAG: tRNA lysidine(34) synthetase TilS [bacterium]|nr:tRNA lysidine(34) synthetase TilS [bacterium]